jgi:hypothetical protein
MSLTRYNIEQHNGKFFEKAVGTSDIRRVRQIAKRVWRDDKSKAVRVVDTETGAATDICDVDHDYDVARLAKIGSQVRR